MELDKAVGKLQEAKTVEERRVIIEELRDRRSRLWELYRSMLNVLMGIVSGQGFATICTAYLYVVKITLFVTIIIAVLQGLLTPLITCIIVLVRAYKQIKIIDNILLDPPMLPVGEKFIIALLILGIAFTIIGTIFGLAALGIIHL
ncbi:MAG: hypothetical protein GXO10_04350 [Crenarchaeota archaeon]|nr:hypothetical protein [Thermoproteota archaeon]